MPAHPPQAPAARFCSTGGGTALITNRRFHGAALRRGEEWSRSHDTLTSKRSRARRLAESHHSTLEALLAALIERLDEAEVLGDPLLGMFAGEPELIDQVVDSALQAREAHPVGVIDG